MDTGDGLMAALTDVRVRHLKPRERAYQVADGEGLILEIRPSGQKAWLYRYRVYGRQEKLSLGSYPDVSIAKARELHADAKKLVAANRSPAQEKQHERQRYSDDLQTVAGLAKAYMADHTDKLVSKERARHYIEKKILPAIGRKFLDEVTPRDCAAIAEKIKHAGAPEVGRKVLEQLRGLFGYAVDRHLITMNPATQVRASRVIGERKSRSRVLSGEEIRRYLATVETLPTSQSNRLAFRLILLTLCRKGELIKARREHVDLDRSEWRIPQENAKNRREHLVYLAPQTRDLFARLVALAGDSPWLLPGRDPRLPITISTLNQALFVAKNRSPDLAWLGTVWIHDLRRTASTHLHELGYSSDVIEKALNHTIDGVRGVYNRAQYADQRRAMLAAWADYVDALCSGADVVPFRQAA
jgi:integrase